MVLAYSLGVRGQTALTRMRGALLTEVAECFHRRDLVRPSRRMSLQLLCGVAGGTADTAAHSSKYAPVSVLSGMR